MSILCFPKRVIGSVPAMHGLAIFLLGLLRRAAKEQLRHVEHSDVFASSRARRAVGQSFAAMPSDGLARPDVGITFIALS
jgi:hypothetical protein